MSRTVECELCPTACVLDEYQVGGCRTRINKGGKLYSLVYAKPCAVAVDPIEKKPFFHFLPGSRAFSLATAGCVLGCKFCQNWEISQASPEEVSYRDLLPDDAVRQALFFGCSSITYTYTEPTVFYEYMYDIALLAERAGLRNTMHSCGYIQPRPLRTLAKHLQAADIDLKSFSEDFYSRICGGRLKPVLDALVVLKEEKVWLEITNLVIPTLNDEPAGIREMCRWIATNLGPDVPLHLSRFFPAYKLKNLPPTPPETLARARKIARDAGLRYVYIGNLRSEAESTFCYRCNRLLVERIGYTVTQNVITAGACPSCRTKIAGIWS
jgi:pyruvate formate lyase activating enzyme